MTWLAELATLLSVIGVGLVTAMKGRPILLLGGVFLTPILWVFGALRLARPTSYWARRFYSVEKLKRSVGRFGSEPSTRDHSVAYAVSLGLVFLAAIAIGAVTALSP